MEKLMIQDQNFSVASPNFLIYICFAIKKFDCTPYSLQLEDIMDNAEIIEAVETEETEETLVIETPEVDDEAFTEEEIQILLSEEEQDSDQTEIGMTRGELKQAIRTNQFNDDEIETLVETEIFVQAEIDVFKANLLEDADEEPPEVKTKEKTKGKTKAKAAPKKESTMAKLVTEVVELLEESETGMTIEEICVGLGVLTEDSDPKDDEVRGIKKKFRSVARKAVDNHPDGSREGHSGRNRLYAIGEIIEEEEEVEEKPRAKTKKTSKVKPSVKDPVAEITEEESEAEDFTDEAEEVEVSEDTAQGPFLETEVEAEESK